MSKMSEQLRARTEFHVQPMTAEPVEAKGKTGI